MIVGDLKPLAEIVSAVKEYKQVLVLGCGSCVTVCLSGGEKEAEHLCREISQIRHYEGAPPRFEVGTIIRQCEQDLVLDYQHLTPRYGCRSFTGLRRGCPNPGGCISIRCPWYRHSTPPFSGPQPNQGIWAEMCRGCGDCVLTFTGGICPVARCAKGLFNGPCGGSQNGSCEVGLDTPCAWAMIVLPAQKAEQTTFIGRDNDPLKDWRPGGSAGPRKRVRVGLGDGTK